MLNLIDPPAAAWVLFIGRILIAFVFLVSGIHKAIWYQKAVEEFTLDGVPLISISLPATILLHLGGAVCLILGVFTELAALVLAIHTAVATYMAHGFWRLEGIERLIRSRVFSAKLGGIGGLRYIAALGPGPMVIG
jgi:uncharacterized membrane protein YphA (DoxX/SURF4 family)